MTAQITTVGHVTHDLYHHGLEAGGCAFYAAKVYGALGVPAELVTLVGDDFRLWRELEDLSVDVAKSGATTTFYNAYPASGPRLQLVEGVGVEIPARTVDASFVHLAPVMGELDLAEWAAANSHATIAINVQGWVKSAQDTVERVNPEWPPGLTAAARVVRQVQWRPTAEALRRVDVACMSEEDLLAQGDLFERIREHVARGCLTFGERGSMVWDDEREWEISAVEADVVDTTGAGDTYAATFCAALNAGRDVPAAGRMAAAAAAVVIEAPGAQALAELRHRVPANGQT